MARGRTGAPPSTDDPSLADYLRSLRSAEPTPGGGSAAAYVGAMGAALAAMVCRLTLKSASDDHGLADAADRLDALVEELSRSAQDDEACFGRYRAAASLPNYTP